MQHNIDTNCIYKFAGSFICQNGGIIYESKKEDHCNFSIIGYTGADAIKITYSW